MTDLEGGKEIDVYAELIPMGGWGHLHVVNDMGTY
jgi:hypothetical protein